jgi:hypothetical protein
MRPLCAVYRTPVTKGRGWAWGWCRESGDLGDTCGLLLMLYVHSRGQHRHVHGAHLFIICTLYDTSKELGVSMVHVVHSITTVCMIDRSS